MKLIRNNVYPNMYKDDLILLLVVLQSEPLLQWFVQKDRALIIYL